MVTDQEGRALVFLPGLKEIMNAYEILLEAAVREAALDSATASTLSDQKRIFRPQLH